MTRPTRQAARPLPITVVGLLALLAALLVLPLALAPRAEAFVYWTNAWTPICGPGGCTGPAAIGRANLDGTDVEPGFITGFNFGAGATGVAVDANHIYWSQFGSQTQTAAIARANLDGTGIDRTFIPFTGDAAHPGAVEVDAAHIYWINAQVTYPGATIGRANLDGTGVDPSFAPGPGLGTSVTDVAADAGHIYWTQVPGGGELTGTIGRAQLDARTSIRTSSPPHRLPPRLASP